MWDECGLALAGKCEGGRMTKVNRDQNLPGGSLLEMRSLAQPAGSPVPGEEAVSADNGSTHAAVLG